MPTQLTPDQIQAIINSAGTALNKTWNVMASKLGAAMSPATQSVGNALMTFLQSPVTDAGAWLKKAASFPSQLAQAAQAELARGFKDDGTLAAVVQKAPQAAQQIQQMAGQVGGPNTFMMLIGAAAIAAVGWYTYKSMTKGGGRKSLSGGRKIEEMDVDEPEESLSEWDDSLLEEPSGDLGDPSDSDVDDVSQDFSDLDVDEPEEGLAGHKRRKTRVRKHVVTWG